MASHYFARIFTKPQVQICQRMLEECAEEQFPIDFSAETFEIKAPDGDVVFAGIKKDPTHYICRLHREVFAD